MDLLYYLVLFACVLIPIHLKVGLPFLPSKKKKKRPTVQKLKEEMYKAIVLDAYEVDEQNRMIIKNGNFTFDCYMDIRGCFTVMCTYKEEKIFYIDYEENIYLHDDETIRKVIALDRDKSMKWDVRSWMTLMKKHYIDTRNQREHKKTITKPKEIERIELFADIQEQIRHLLEKREFMTEEHVHTLEETYPNDMLELNFLYEKLTDKAKEEMNEIIAETKEKIKTKLIEIEHYIQTNVMKQVQTKAKVWESR